MEYDIILTTAESIPEAFDAGNDLIRLNCVCQDELETVNNIIGKNPGILLITLPHSREA